MSKRKPNLTLREKCAILEKIAKGDKTKDLCKIFSINKSSICRIIQNKQTIEDFAENTKMNPKKVKRISKAADQNIIKSMKQAYYN